MPSIDIRTSTPPSRDNPPGNLLLAALPEAERAHLRPLLTPVRIKHHQLLHDVSERITHVYFPVDAVVSLLTLLRDGTSVEMAAVGYEGMVGMPLFSGVDTANHQAQGQVTGTALQMDAGDFRAALEKLPGLHRVLHRYVQVRFLQFGQGVACSARHALGERCARWLLVAHDRAQRDEFSLTQDFMASMLGARRPSVTNAIGILQQAGFIKYHRGRVAIIERKGLETFACECYRFIADHTDRLLSPGY